MKLTISKETLVEQLSHIAGAVEKKQTSKILENIYINLSEHQLQLIGTDLEIELSSTIDIQGESIGQITAPAKKLLDICKALPNDCFILLETDDNARLKIKGLRSRFELSTLPAEDFPILDDIPIQNEYLIPENRFKELIDHVSFSMASQDVRYYLNGLYLEFNESGLTAVATDGHRLAISFLPNQFVEAQSSNDSVSESAKNSLIIPRKAVLEMSRILDSHCEIPLRLQISQNHIRIYKDNIRFTSKLIEGKYPDYQAAIPLNPTTTIILDREMFRDTLSRVAILSNEKFRGIRISLSPGLMKLHSNNPENEMAEEELDIEFNGEPMDIGFNVTYMLEAINHIEDKTIQFELTSPANSSLIYSPEDPATRYVVMPIRI